jgi:hypothetical protein
MLKFEMKLTGAQKAAIRASATPQALRNLFFNQIINETNILYEKSKRNALEIPEQPTGRLASSIRKGFDTSSNQIVGRVLPDQRIAPYAEFVEFGHYARNRSTWVPGLHYMELAYIETRRESKRRIESGMTTGLKWYDSPGAVHKVTGEKLAIL